MSYNLFGALEEEPETSKKNDEDEQNEAANDNHVERQPSEEGEQVEETKGARTVSQAQLESSMEQVRIILLPTVKY